MSITIGSLFVLLLDMWVKSQNVDLGPDALQTWLENTLMILAPVGIWFGRVRAGGVTWYGARKR